MHKQKVRWILKTHRQVETGRRCGGRIKSTEIVNGRCWLLTGVHRCCQCAGMHGMSAFDLGNFGKTSGSNWLNGSKLVQARNDAQFVLSIFVDQLNERWACFDSIRHYKNPTKVFLTEICKQTQAPENLRDFEKKNEKHRPKFGRLVNIIWPLFEHFERFGSTPACVFTSGTGLDENCKREKRCCSSGCDVESGEPMEIECWLVAGHSLATSHKHIPLLFSLKKKQLRSLCARRISTELHAPAMLRVWVVQIERKEAHRLVLRLQSSAKAISLVRLYRRVARSVHRVEFQ